MLFTAVLWARHHKLGPTHIHMNIMARLTYTRSLSIGLAVKVCVYCAWVCVGESRACLCNLLVHAHWTCFTQTQAVFAGWIHAFGVCLSVSVFVCASERERECLSLRPFLWCLPHSGAAISVPGWCKNFYFSISFPDGAQFAVSILVHNDTFWLS